MMISFMHSPPIIKYTIRAGEAHTQCGAVLWNLTALMSNTEQCKGTQSPKPLQPEKNTTKSLMHSCVYLFWGIFLVRRTSRWVFGARNVARGRNSTLSWTCFLLYNSFLKQSHSALPYPKFCGRLLCGGARFASQASGVRGCSVCVCLGRW